MSCSNTRRQTSASMPNSFEACGTVSASPGISSNSARTRCATASTFIEFSFCASQQAPVQL
jgi:hypothetical protein